jgi:addiction module RelE/StbE family toxin
MTIQWSSTAVADLESIREYISKDSSTAARKISKRIKQGVNRLSEFPLSGRAGRVLETRELVIPGTPYIAAYTIQGDDVLIAAVLHGRQNWPESFEERAGITP